MKHLQQKYAKNGFQVIQAHSAEYNFTKDVSNIQRALLRYNIKNIPVAFETDNRIWEVYGNILTNKSSFTDFS